jgi:hypothetical protein
MESRKPLARTGCGSQTRSVIYSSVDRLSHSDRLQTANNACASVALLNIVNNIPDIDLGENLKSFKEFTMPFTPALRGDAINNFEFVKRIHNSFARYESCFRICLFKILIRL